VAGGSGQGDQPGLQEPPEARVWSPEPPDGRVALYVADMKRLEAELQAKLGEEVGGLFVARCVGFAVWWAILDSAVPRRASCSGRTCCTWPSRITR
jgi:hypothetical protein